MDIFSGARCNSGITMNYVHYVYYVVYWLVLEANVAVERNC